MSPFKNALLLSSLVISSQLLGVAPTPTVPPTTSRVFNPNDVKDSHRIWIEEDVLLWQAMEGGLDFATKSDSSSAIRNGRVHGLDFDWDWGCRLGVGYKVPHDILQSA